MSILFMAACWAVCAASGVLIAPGTPLWIILVLTWHGSMIIMFPNGRGVEVSDDRNR